MQNFQNAAKQASQFAQQASQKATEAAQTAQQAAQKAQETLSKIPGMSEKQGSQQQTPAQESKNEP